MRHLAQLALVACVAVAGSSVDAAPERHHHGKVRKKSKHRHARPREEAMVDADAAELVDAPEPPRERAATATRKDWQLAIGPNIWAASVDANVSVGGSNVGAGIDFFQLEHHVRYGVPVLAEARFGRLSLVADVTYGVIDVDGGRDVGPLMVTVGGTASSLMADGFAGYTLAGDAHSLLSFEARGGVRYQRTAISGSVEVGGSPVVSAAQVNTGADGLVGARAFVRPSSRFAFCGAFDFGMIGTSTLTWSASADASVRITSRLQASLGWRTLTVNSAYVGMVMHGPRAAVQLVF